MRGCLLATRPPRSLFWNFISLPSTFVLTTIFSVPLPLAIKKYRLVSGFISTLSWKQHLFLPSFIFLYIFFLPLPLFLLLLLLLLELLPLPLLLLFSRAPSDLLAFSSCFFQSQTLVVGTYLLEATCTHTGWLHSIHVLLCCSPPVMDYVCTRTVYTVVWIVLVAGREKKFTYSTRPSVNRCRWVYVYVSGFCVYKTRSVF